MLVEILGGENCPVFQGATKCAFRNIYNNIINNYDYFKWN